MQDTERDMERNEYFVKYLDEKFKHLNEKVGDLSIGQNIMREEMRTDRQALSDFKFLVLDYPIKQMLEDIEELKTDTDVPRFLSRHSTITNRIIQWIIAFILLFATGGSILSISDFLKEKKKEINAVREPLEQNSLNFEIK